MKRGDCLNSTPEFLLRLLLKQYDHLDWITSPYPYLPRSPEDGRVERHKFNIGTRQLSRIRRPALRAHTHARATCVLWRDNLDFVISGDVSHVTCYNYQPGRFYSNCGFLCSQVTNHSSRDKMLVFNQTVLLCSNFVCICRLICWMILRILSSCSARALPA